MRHTFNISVAVGRRRGSFVRHFAMKSWNTRDLQMQITVNLYKLLTSGPVKLINSSSLLMYWSNKYILNINLLWGIIYWGSACTCSEVTGPRISKGNKTSDDGYNKTVTRREPKHTFINTVLVTLCIYTWD